LSTTRATFLTFFTYPFGNSDFGIPGIAEQEVVDTRDAFNFFDQDNTGTVDLNELLKTMQELGMAAKNPGAFRMLTKMSESNARVDFEEFVDMMTARMNYRESTNDLSEVFKMFDSDGTGKISLQNLREVSAEMGEDLADEELMDLLIRADGDGDNELSEAEFQLLMKSETAM
jgi:Ca2+-binding EF-hand superfamily protein